MLLDCYLAMTAAEFASCASLPPKLAWMACHFSCYGTGLSNLPASLPEGAMIILNDRTPIQGHDPQLILEQLLELADLLKPNSILLDLQRPEQPQTAELVRVLTEGLSYPVGVSSMYARDLDCPVFLDAPPPHHSLETHIKPWTGREVWLEAAAGNWEMTVDSQGSHLIAVADGPLPEPWFREEATCCRYHVTHDRTQARFSFQRTAEDLQAQLEQARALGITKSVGLYQQFKHIIDKF